MVVSVQQLFNVMELSLVLRMHPPLASLDTRLMQKSSNIAVFRFNELCLGGKQK